MSHLLTTSLQATHVDVKDVSGGCGSFYNVTVVSPQFEGLSPIKQHKWVLSPPVFQHYFHRLPTQTADTNPNT